MWKPAVSGMEKVRIRTNSKYGLQPVEDIGVFRDPKNGDVRNKNPPAMRVESNRYTEKHLSVTIELFSHYCKKGKVFYGE